MADPASTPVDLPASSTDDTVPGLLPPYVSPQLIPQRHTAKPRGNRRRSHSFSSIHSPLATAEAPGAASGSGHTLVPPQIPPGPDAIHPALQASEMPIPAHDGAASLPSEVPIVPAAPEPTQCHVEDTSAAAAPATAAPGTLAAVAEASMEGVASSSGSTEDKSGTTAKKPLPKLRELCSRLKARVKKRLQAIRSRKLLSPTVRLEVVTPAAAPVPAVPMGGDGASAPAPLTDALANGMMQEA